ncbi:hypothetical protein F4821DRAFT_280496 [Hypoxylon rubiginosum]|uniref:Uncharacterized protein n=1 Tax=Hypoxylon rubiginosum TaxID=110542 RepID=A0ACC0CUN1_9PEZI|nr:hypothetical protein F4821DRAFT_280496 [Hypoxylon rubiginosum]
MSRSPQSVSKYASSGNKKSGRAWFKFEGDPKYLPKLKGGWISASYSEGKKRPRRDDSESEEDRERGKPKRQRGKPRMPDPGRTCGNCHKVGHTARDCIKVGRSGWMDGACPKCNTPGHLYESCRYRDSKEDVDILFWYRMNKGPVKSALNIGRLLQAAISDENNTRFKTDSVLPPPYTPKYARQIQRDHRWEEWVYYFEGRPEWEAERRKYEPQFYEFTLERIARLFDHAGWTMAAENVNPAGDGPMPSMSRYLVMPSLASNETTHATEDVGAAAGTAVTEPLLREFNRLLESRGEAISGPQGTSTTRAVRCSVLSSAEMARLRASVKKSRAHNAK